MSSADGHDGHPTFSTRFHDGGRFGDLETMLFESLIHHMIEKGLLTKNDALSVIETVAQVKLGQLDDEAATPVIDAEIALLRRLYSSFEMLGERSPAEVSKHGNIRQLRPPYHGDAPKFPHED